MEYFPRGDTIYRKVSGCNEPLAVLKISGNVKNVVTNLSQTLMAICVERNNESELDVYAFRRSEIDAGVSLHKTDFCGINLGSTKQVFLYWNPVAYLDAGLFVLTDLSCFCIYCAPALSNKLKNIEILSLEGEYGLTIAASCITSGSSRSPLGVLTSYFTSSDGDIYLVRPFVPQRIALTSEQIRSVTKFDPSVLGGFRGRNESWCDRRQEKVYVFERDSIASGTTLHFKLPLPMKLEPYPDYFYTEEVFDSKVGSFGLNTDVLIQTTSQFVNFWALPHANADKLILVASVKFTEKCPRTITDVNEQSVKIKDQNSIQYLIILDSTFKKKPNVVKLDSNDQDPSVSPVVGSSDLDASSYTLTFSSQTTRIIDPDFNSKILAELSDKVVEPNVPECLTELSGNVLSLAELYKVSTSFQKKALVIMKLIAKLRTQRAAQKHEADNQRKALSHIKELKDIHSNTQESNSSKIEKITSKHNDLKKRLDSLRLQVSNHIARRSPAFPEAGANETKLFEELRNEKLEEINGLEEAISKLDGVLKHVKSLPPWYMLENNEETISPAEQQELKVLLAEQSKQISDLELLII